jgi:hypothetical protein
VKALRMVFQNRSYRQAGESATWTQAACLQGRIPLRGAPWSAGSLCNGLRHKGQDLGQGRNPRIGSGGAAAAWRNLKLRSWLAAAAWRNLKLRSWPASAAWQILKLRSWLASAAWQILKLRSWPASAAWQNLKLRSWPASAAWQNLKLRSWAAGAAQARRTRAWPRPACDEPNVNGGGGVGP